MQVGSICINLHFNHFYVGLVKLPGPVHYTTLLYLTLTHPVLLFLMFHVSSVSKPYRTAAIYCTCCKWQPLPHNRNNNNNNFHNNALLMSCINYTTACCQTIWHWAIKHPVSHVSPCQIVKPGLTFHKCDSKHEHKMSNRDSRPNRKRSHSNRTHTHSHTHTRIHPLITTLIWGNIYTCLHTQSTALGLHNWHI